MKDSLIVGVILIIIGGIETLRTVWFIRFQIWVQKTLMGADYVPSARTYTVVRIVGAFIMVLGFSVLLWGE
ncbi:MAG: hypothetical protein NUV60_03595 [Patescibacteria group bacterium]|nr:hypothetical protein [Patescibacteria group bacterium]